MGEFGITTESVGLGWRHVGAAITTVAVLTLVVSVLSGAAGATPVETAATNETASTVQSSTGELTCERRDSGVVLRNDAVRYLLSNGTSGNYIQSVDRVDGDTLVTTVGQQEAVGWYLFSDGDRLRDRELIGDRIQEEETDDGRAACVYSTALQVSAANGDSYFMRASTALVAGEQGATTTIQLLNPDEETNELDLPGGFVESGVRVGSLELADKSGDYQFHVPGTGTRTFNATSYWQTFPLSESRSSVVAFNADSAFAFSYHNGTTPPVGVMTEDGNEPRQNSDRLTYDVGSVELGYEESARWTVTSAALPGGADTPERYREALPEPTGLTLLSDAERALIMARLSEYQDSTDESEADPVETDVSVGDVSAGESVTRNTDDLASADNNATLRSVSVTPRRDIADHSVSISQSERPQSSSPEESLPNGAAPLNYLSIDASEPDAAFERVSLTVAVDRSVVKSLPNTEPSEVTVFRFQDGWQDVAATLIREEGEELIYEVTATGFSEWATGAKRPDFRILDAAVDVSEIEAGEDLGVRVRITNTGGADGEYTTELLLDEAVIDSDEVNIAAGGTQRVTFEESVGEPGEYTVLVNDAEAGEVEVEDESDSDAAGNESGGLPTGPLAGGAAVGVALLAGGYLYVRGG